MKKETTPKTQPSITSVDFCIHTHENTEGLEKLLHSIANDARYRGARIYIADSSKQLDRGYYKELRKELGEAGLLNRLTIHSVGYKSNMAVVRNFFLTVTNSKYKLFLCDKDIVTEKTDVFSMMTVMEGNKTIGVVGGSINTDGEIDTPETDGKPMEEDGVKFEKTTHTNDFILLRGDVRHVLRYDVNAENPNTNLCNTMRSVGYQMVNVAGVEIERISDKKENDGNTENQSVQTENKESNSTGGGSTTEHDVPTRDGGNKGRKDSVSVGKNEKGKNTATRGR